MTDIQSLIADIDDALAAGSRLPWTKPEGARERRVLERVRRYLSQQHIQPPPPKPSLDREIEALRMELVQSIRAEVDALRREREGLIAEIRQMQSIKETAIPVESPSRQSSSDQILTELDSTQRIVFEALQRNLHSYDQSLSQGLEKMHSLSNQGEAIFTAFIAHLTQHLAQMQLPTAPPATEAAPSTIEPDLPDYPYPYAGMEVETASTDAVEESPLSSEEEMVSLDGWDLEMADLIDEADIDTIIQYDLPEAEAEPPINQEQVEQLYENLFGANSVQVTNLEEQETVPIPDVPEDASNVEEALFGGMSDPADRVEEASIVGEEDLVFEGEIGASADFQADSEEVPADLLALLPPLEESLAVDEGEGEHEEIASLSDLAIPESDPTPEPEEDSYIPASPEENLLVSEELGDRDVSVSINPNTLQQLSSDLSRYEDPSLTPTETEQVLPLPERLTEIEQNSFLTNSTVGTNAEEIGDYEWEYDPEALSEASPIVTEDSDRLVPGSADYSELGFEPDLFPTDELLATPADLSESSPFIEMAWDEPSEAIADSDVEEILISQEEEPLSATDEPVEAIADSDVEEILIPQEEEPLSESTEAIEDTLATDSAVTEEGMSTDMASESQGFTDVGSNEQNNGTTESSTLPDDYDSR